jgi:hypothetical protein
MESLIDDVHGGWQVFDRDGAKIGTVYDVGLDYVQVQKGIFSTTNIYIPFTAIVSTADERVLLDVLEPEIKNLGWDVPPSD